MSKRYGDRTAVGGIDLKIATGEVYALLGPDDAGETTTLRMLLGLVAPIAGEALIGGHRYVDLRDPRRVVGAVLETTSFHPGRTGRDHLRILATAAGIPRSRVDEVLVQVSLADAAGRRERPALDRLITDLFSYARMEYLGQQAHREPVDLTARLHTTTRAHQPRADTKHIALIVTKPATACTVNADEHIAPADLPHLFMPLYRGENSRHRATAPPAAPDSP